MTRTTLNLKVAAACTLACLTGALPGPASAQVTTPVVVEADVTAGITTENHVKAAATQIRAFGETKLKIRFHVEATWGDRTQGFTDAFGAAYPYGGKLDLSEAYVERFFTRGNRILAVRAGQYRSPFGLSARSDHAYAGFLRAPLMRYDGYWSVTNNFLERGVAVVAGTAHLSGEASIGAPGDLGPLPRRRGLDVLVRAQGHAGPLTLGVSHISSPPYLPAFISTGRLRLTGADLRWMAHGVQVRGEWVTGQPWDGPSTKGGYVDVAVHRPFLGPVTLVARTEKLDYESPLPFPWFDELHTDWAGSRHSVGARIRLPRGLTVQANLIRQGHELGEYTPAAFDIAVTYSLRRH